MEDHIFMQASLAGSLDEPVKEGQGSKVCMFIKSTTSVSLAWRCDTSASAPGPADRTVPQECPDGRGLQKKKCHHELALTAKLPRSAWTTWSLSWRILFSSCHWVGCWKTDPARTGRTEWPVLVFYYFTYFRKSEHWCGSAAVRKGSSTGWHGLGLGFWPKLLHGVAQWVNKGGKADSPSPALMTQQVFSPLIHAVEINL